MAFSNSMFLLEFIVEELKSYVDCKRFCIKTQFADVFSVQLIDPNQLEKERASKIKGKRKRKVRHFRFSTLRPTSEPKVESGQSILLASNIDTLIENMRKYSMELFLYSHKYPEYKLGSTHIAWNPVYIDYLNKISRHDSPPPVVASAEHNVFDEYTSRRMASIKLNIKLSHIKSPITTSITPLCEEYKNTFIYSDTDMAKKKSEEKENGVYATGVVKTVYNNGKAIKASRTRYRPLKKNVKNNNSIQNEIKTPVEEVDVANKVQKVLPITKIRKSIVSFTKSEADIDCKKQITIIRSKSYTKIDFKERFDTLNYIFNDPVGPFGNRVYCVGYFTVENNSPTKTSPVSSRTSSPKRSAPFSTKAVSSEVSGSSKPRYTFKLCDNNCQQKGDESGVCNQSVTELDLPQEAAKFVSVKKCKLIECHYRNFLKPLPSVEDRVLLDLSSLNKKCCQQVKEVEGEMTTKMEVGDYPCYCTCECRFDFYEKTTFCNICGGYERMGEDIKESTKAKPQFPCPVYHNLLKKPLGSPAYDTMTRRKYDDASKATSKEKRGSDKKSVESEKDKEKAQDKKGKKKIKDDRFKFNYGYAAPQIGHSQCAMPCTGTLGQVPKNMGWLWNADNVPGLKFRPNWKPGAANKHVVRLLRIARYPEQAVAKRRKKDSGKKKRSLKRPLLVVQKKNGEYTVTMETMKVFNKFRPPNQYPYEDKPLETYTIGRTEEENRLRKMKKERAHRRLEREQREFIQSAFRDMCKEICLKTYQQALGLLPDAEDPECTCYPAEPGPDKTNLEHSCSCSDSLSSFGSDTDDDEWIIEFTPPHAQFDPSYKSKKPHTADNSTQYTYMDYRVKLLDRYGNPVPRFFTGPDGNEQCSDLGGFWNPDHKWLEINVDGFIAPDGRWAPHTFFGPNGEQIDTDNGKFQAADGTWLVIGVDGFIDAQNKWHYYSQSKPQVEHKKRTWRKSPIKNMKDGDKDAHKTSEATWSCFGDASPKRLTHMGIIGHGQDRKLLLSTLEKMLAQGKDVKIPKQPIHPRSARKKGKKASHVEGRSHYTDKIKCKHAIPSTKGIVAVNEQGHKTYFKLTDYKNPRPKERKVTLGAHGISLSSFHVPCLSSFISSEALKQQQYEHILAHNARYKTMKSVATG